MQISEYQRRNHKNKGSTVFPFLHHQHPQALLQQMVLPGSSSTLPIMPSDRGKKKKRRKTEVKHAKITVTSSLSFQQEDEDSEALSSRSSSKEVLSRKSSSKEDIVEANLKPKVCLCVCVCACV